MNLEGTHYSSQWSFSSNQPWEGEDKGNDVRLLLGCLVVVIVALPPAWNCCCKKEEKVVLKKGEVRDHENSWGQKVHISTSVAFNCQDGRRETKGGWWMQTAVIKGMAFWQGCRIQFRCKMKWPRGAEASTRLQKGEGGQECRVNCNEISGSFQWWHKCPESSSALWCITQIHLQTHTRAHTHLLNSLHVFKGCCFLLFVHDVVTVEHTVQRASGWTPQPDAKLMWVV